MERMHVLESIANNLAKSIFMKGYLKKVLSFFFKKIYIEPIEKKRNKIFLKNGVEVLRVFDSVMNANNIIYSLDFGSLLGAVRESGFIKHDLDIDVAVSCDVDKNLIEKKLQDVGFKLHRRIIVDEGKFGIEETYIKNDVSLDIFYYYPYKNGSYYCTWFLPFEGCASFKESVDKHGGLLPVMSISPFSEDVEYVKFENIQLPCFRSSEKYLIAKYGTNWRIPDPTCVYPNVAEGTINIECEDKVGVIIGSLL